MFFQFFDSFFYISLAITFGLILLMVFHFKNRIHTLEEKNQDLSEMCQMMIKELQEVKHIQQHAVIMPPTPHKQFQIAEVIRSRILSKRESNKKSNRKSKHQCIRRSQ